MLKYVVYIISGNDKKLVSIHDEKAEALERGQQVHDELPRKGGVVSCMAEEFDCENNKAGTKSCIHKVWM